MTTRRHDLKLLNVFDHFNMAPGFSSSVRTEFREIAEALDTSIKRIITLVTTPPLLVGMAMVDQLSHCIARFRVTNDPAIANPTPEQVQQIDAMYRQVAQEQLQRAGGADLDLHEKLRVGKDNVNHLAAAMEPIWLSLETTLHAVVINSWTAFEAASIDLWVEALNVKPNPFAMSALSNQPRKREDDLGVQGTAKQDRSVKVKPLVELYIDEGADALRPGELLRRTRWFDFEWLEGIKDAYERAFGDDVEQVWSNAEFLNLSVLEGVRNVLVHRGGIVDTRFRQRVRERPEL